ncbi:NAD(P)H-dependent oxidoreductase [uncultured Cardiobacterium sp.]|uniref:NAD(P)H-dependent oxidoreductase n=1 Tax=uncultured Cardiobacterium sp. TaxID=417619 RepID=UPI00260D5685|nr:NAD(P)H-dependent oxidoreductase [uncultured Cardiobacterium sp.]
MTFSKQDILDAFKRRAATRYYDGSRKIGDEDMNFILELGRLSPSSVGSEPWRFVVVQNRALRDAIKPVGWGVANQLDVGIDSCPIEGFNYAAVNKIFADAGIFDPAEWGIAVMATFGYRSRDIMPKARKPFDEVVQWVY